MGHQCPGTTRRPMSGSHWLRTKEKLFSDTSVLLQTEVPEWTVFQAGNDGESQEHCLCMYNLLLLFKKKRNSSVRGWSHNHRPQSSMGSLHASPFKQAKKSEHLETHDLKKKKKRKEWSRVYELLSTKIYQALSTT